MKNNYRKLKRAILIRTLLIMLLAAAIGYGLLTFVVDGIFQDGFANLIVGGLTRLGLDDWRAVEWYQRIFRDNKLLWILSGFVLLFFAFFYLSIGRMTRYLNDISDALEKVIHGSEEPIMLVPELEPMAEQIATLKRELFRREQEAAVSEKKKNELVAYLAHDLKTPLTSVVAYLTMLDEHPDMSAEERAKYTHVTLEKAFRLEELINEFFDITRFNLQDFVLEKVEMNLSIFLEQIADESYGMLNEKGMTCAVDVEEDLMIQGDPDKLARVFDNLLRNAAAYGLEHTQVLIQARGGIGRTTIIFMNEGPQIPQKKLEMIFERFYRVDDARSSRTGGAGLGLAIAKQIVELHGGTISAVSDRRNTRFIVTLPGGSKESSGSHRAGPKEGSMLQQKGAKEAFGLRQEGRQDRKGGPFR